MFINLHYKLKWGMLLISTLFIFILLDGNNANITAEVANNPVSVTDWVPEDGHKMHFPQLPDEAGWDVNATQPLVLAEDWMCSETGWVKDVHFWGSWMHGVEGVIVSFVLSIHEDIPAGVVKPHSMPGQTLWEREIQNFNFIPIDPPSQEGWYDPAQGIVMPDDHQAYFQYNVFLDEPDWFWQEEGTIYWLNISAIVMDPTTTQWGWKSSLDRWNDDAVWGLWGDLDWIEMFEPPDFQQSLNLSFVITGGEDTCEYYKPQYLDYAPQGMPDFDQKQSNWSDAAGWTHCGPTAVANCLWWFDSKFEPNPIDPRPFGVTAPNDGYPLVTSFGGWDDHDPNNVQPLINQLAGLMNTNTTFRGTLLNNLVSGTQQYFANAGLASDFKDTVVSLPTIDYIREQVLDCQDVILLLGFYEFFPGTSMYCPLGAHYVTVAGVCTTQTTICISDPYFDVLEGEPPAGSAHASNIHNDADNISGPHGQVNHDPYLTTLTSMPPPWGSSATFVNNYPISGADIPIFAGANTGSDVCGYQGGQIVTIIDAAYVICPDTIPDVDTVVCEPQGGNNPSHPGIYWYDVTPGGGTGRCDFHVKVQDSIFTHYSNWVEPVGWQHALHKVGNDWWISFWDPTCTNAIFTTFRFQFVNPNIAVWGDWTTTMSATNQPFNQAVDSSANHTLDPDGYGYHVHVPFWEEAQEPDSCEYYKPRYEDYSPSGMPDFDQKQSNWMDFPHNAWSHSGPVALANCFWWFDSKFEPNPIDPRPFQPSVASPPLNDGYPLVQSYDPAGVWDDHDTNNVIPFVDSLALYCNTNANPSILGTTVQNLEIGARRWLQNRGLDTAYTVDLVPFPPHDLIIQETLRSQNVILLLGFWQEDPAGSICCRYGGHYVTMAGACSTETAICISDPFIDKNEGEPPAGSAHTSGIHNDAFNISGPHGTMHHDKYFVGPPQIPCVTPAITQLYNYPASFPEYHHFEQQNVGDPTIPPCPYLGGQFYTVVEFALIICPVVVDTCAGQLPGDADGSGAINMGDVTFLLNHFNLGGPPPSPKANGDPNGDCIVNNADVSYLQNFLFTGGPEPVPCTCVDPYITCCKVRTGNVDNDPLDKTDIGDLTKLIDYLFISLVPPVCLDEANCDGLGAVDIGDLTALIDYLFISLTPPALCQ